MSNNPIYGIPVGTGGGSKVKEYVDQKVAELVDAAPETLDTLNELAKALGDDPNFATTIAMEIGKKVDKQEGKALSTNDYTDEEKSKLSKIESGAQKNVQADWNQTDKSKDDYIQNKPALGKLASKSEVSKDDLTDNLANMIDGKQETLVSGTNIKTINEQSVLGKGNITVGVQSDWNQTDSKQLDFINNKPNISSWAQSTTKPTYSANEINGLATVATTGSYDSLSNKPTHMYNFTTDLGANGWYRVAHTDIGHDMGSYNGLIEFIGKREKGQMHSSCLASIVGSFTSAPQITILGSTNAGGNPIDQIRVVYVKSNPDNDIRKYARAFLDIHITNAIENSGIEHEINFTVKTFNTTGLNYYTTTQLVDDSSKIPSVSGLSTSDWGEVIKSSQDSLSSLVNPIFSNLNTRITENEYDISILQAQLNNWNVLKITSENSYDKRITADGKHIVNGDTNVQKILGNTLVVDSEIKSSSISGIKSMSYNLMPDLDNILNDLLSKGDDGSYILRRGSFVPKSIGIDLLPNVSYTIKFTHIEGSNQLRARFMFVDESTLTIDCSNGNKTFTLDKKTQSVSFYLPSEGSDYKVFKNLQITTTDNKDLPYMPNGENTLRLSSDNETNYTLASFSADFASNRSMEYSFDYKEYIDLTQKKLYKFKDEYSIILVHPEEVISITETCVLATIPNASFVWCDYSDGYFNDNGEFIGNIHKYNAVKPIKFIDLPQNVSYSPTLTYGSSGEYVYSGRFYFDNTTKEAVEALNVLLFDTSGENIDYLTSPFNVTNLSNFATDKYIAYNKGTEEIIGNDNAQHGVYPTIIQDYLIFTASNIQ